MYLMAFPRMCALGSFQNLVPSCKRGNGGDYPQGFERTAHLRCANHIRQVDVHEIITICKVSVIGVTIFQFDELQGKFP